MTHSKDTTAWVARLIADPALRPGARHFWRDGFGNPGFLRWNFASGMRFGAARIWWSPERDRSFPHEGLDFRAYDTPSGVQTLAAGAPVPNLWPGRIERIFRDIIGSTLLISHDVAGDEGSRLHSILAHVAPLPQLAPGATMSEPAPIATLAPPPSRLNAPAHLHLSLMWLTAEQSAELSDWPWIEQHAELLMDPAPILSALAADA